MERVMDENGLPMLLAVQEKVVLSMSTNIGNPKCNIQDDFGINKCQFSASITVTTFKLTLADNRIWEKLQRQPF